MRFSSKSDNDLMFYSNTIYIPDDIFQFSYDLLLCYVPYVDTIIRPSTDNQVWVVRMEAHTVYRLLVFRHDGHQLELIKLSVQL